MERDAEEGNDDDDDDWSLKCRLLEENASPLSFAPLSICCFQEDRWGN